MTAFVTLSATKSTPNAISVDFEKLSADAVSNVIYQGLKYFRDAAHSHARAKAAEVNEDGTPKGNAPYDSGEVDAKVLARFYAPTWAARTAGEGSAARDPVEQAFLDVLEERFSKAGALKRKSKNNPEAVTTEGLVNGASGETFLAKAEAAYRAVHGAWAAPKFPDPAEREARASKGWAAIVAEANKLAKTRASEDTL